MTKHDTIRERLKTLTTQYINYKTIVDIKSRQNITANYTPVNGSSHQLYSSSMDMVTLFRLENKYIEFIEQFERALLTLDNDERTTFYKTYILKEKTDFCYRDMGISRTTFFRTKKKAERKLLEAMEGVKV